ncbi:dystonin isoform X5 [Mixophyes fleayi]|uniref:dystonin isoform X5 n=1 Tax=Mixophyes fleayi TaxID=3061075 RepID=UPI003F4E24C9
MIAAAFLVLLRPYSIQCALLLLFLMLGTIATISFLFCWHRKIQKGRHPMKSVFSYRPRSRDAILRSHHFRSEGFRPSPRHLRRYARARVEETKPLAEDQQSEQDTSSTVRKRKIKRSSRVQPEFYQSVQVTPTRKPSSGTASYRCSMSSSADFSDDEDFSQKSGSASPAPGDTLPWNLPRHERCKRKTSGAAVLDPAERAVLRIADERDKVQKKTFTKWINQHLMKVRKHVGDLYEDLRDGHNLISLLEVLSGDTLPRERDILKTLRLPREKGRMRFHRLQNVQIALDYLKKRQVKLVNIRNDDITDGNPKLTLGLIWTIILHFQISDIHVTGESEDMSAKEKLLLWTKHATDGYRGISCENFTTCWRDGRLFNAIIHRYRPDLIDMDTVAVQSNITNLENAFYVAEKLGVTRLLDPEDVDVSSPDEKSVITYVSSMYDVFPKTPDGGEGISANDVEVKWVEYQNMVNYLIQWIRHHVTLMSDRNFPNTAVELKALYNQYLQFKEKDIPPKETEKAKIKHLYTMLETWIEFGRIKLCQGYHPNDIEKEWGKLIIAMFEREKAIRPEIERLEMLQQIANRVQRDNLGCEDKLILARSALQADGKRMESGIQFQNEAEIAGYLIECENLLRQQLVDVQALVDGKYYQADQLVQRVASLRDELLSLRNEYSSIYSKGRMISSDQTQLMISGISQSLNSGFSQSLNPAMNSSMSHSMAPMSPTSLTSGMSGSMTPGLPSNFNPGLQSSLSSGFSHGFNSHQLTPAMTPTFAPNFNPGLIQNYGGGMNTNALQSLKLMQVKKPLLKSSLADQNLPEEEGNITFVQDLVNWVEEMQIQLDRGEWGSELSSIEIHIENHKNFQGAVEEFETSLKEAKMSELQMTGPLKSSYSDTLHKIEGLYSKLLNSSRTRQKHLDSLHSFVSRATRELIWLNEKEEEEVAYDWSDRNQNISAKKDYHADLMRELDHKEEVIKSVQDTAEQMLLQSHPARSTIEAYKSAMQTQWNWILQLCSCVEHHIRQNTSYFEYFSDAKESTDYLKTLKDCILRKYSCDKSTAVHKLEDLVQESMEEKEQLLQYKSTIASLVGRAKSVIQLKPRNPDNPLKASIPIRAICDYRQIEITIYKEDECVLASNSHRAKWKVISPTGNEAMVPSVCFTVPPPNKEAVDSANRIEQMYQSVLSLWHESHINMKSMVSWHYLMNEIEAIRGSKVSSIKTSLPGEHQQVLSNLKSRFDEFLEDSQESKMFSVSDIGQLEREVNVCKVYYEDLLTSAEREEQEESIYNLYTSEIRNFRLRLENLEERLIRQIRTPLDRDDLHESALRISEQEKLKKDLDHLKIDLSAITDKCEEFFSQAAVSPSIGALQAELNAVNLAMTQIYSMSSIYLEKLRSINLVLKNTQGAESLVKTYETKLCEEDVITADRNTIDRLITTLKQWRSEADKKREVFHALEDELQKAKTISDQMFKIHKERDLDFDWHKEKADQIAERWQNAHSQIENRLRDLDGISKSLKYYKESYLALDSWIRQIEETQSKLQDSMPDGKALAKLLDQQKMLISEIEMKQSKMDECQKYSEQYSLAIKDYELQLMTYRALVDSHQKSPMKRRRFQSSSDVIVQEYMDLRTRYSALMTLISQFIKFSGESLKRLEEEEKSLEEEKREHVTKAGNILNWVSKVTKTLSKEGGGGESAEKKPFSEPQVSSEEILTKQEEISDALQTLQLLLAKHGDRMTDEERAEIEKQIKSLQESQSVLSREYERQQQEAKDLVDKLVEQKVDKVVSGTIDEANGIIRSVYQSMLEGLVDYETGILLLEMQLIVSGLVCPHSKIIFDIEEAKCHALIDEHIQLRLQELSHAKNIILSLSSSEFPIITAYDQGLISEAVTIKMISTLLSCGCLQIPATGEQLNANKLFQRNLISTLMFTKLIQKEKTGKDLIDPIAAEKVTLAELFQRSVVDKKTGMRFLLVNGEEKGKIILKSGRRISVLRAAHEGILEREVMYRLLGAQLFSGGIIDPDSGKRLSLEQSREQGVIDQGTVCGILTQQVENGGILCPSTRKYLTVDQAVQCDLISYSSALMVLEAQRGFIGLIWPDTSEIFPISTSLQQGMISNELAHKILSNRQKIAGLYVPETSEIVRLEIAAQLGIIENNTASLLRELELQDKMPNIDVLEPTCKHALKWMSSYESRAAELNENSEMKSEETLTHNPDHTKQLFISYLMINSYMDANTGERLLLFDGDLDEAASMLLESELIVRTSSESEEEFPSALGIDLAIKDTDHNVDKINTDTDSDHFKSDSEKIEKLEIDAEQVKPQYLGDVDSKYKKDVLCQQFQKTEADDTASKPDSKLNTGIESNGINEELRYFPSKNNITADVQSSTQCDTIISADTKHYHSIHGNNAVDCNCSDGISHTEDSSNYSNEAPVTPNIDRFEEHTENKVTFQEYVPFDDNLEETLNLANDNCPTCTDNSECAMSQSNSIENNVALSNPGRDVSNDLPHDLVDLDFEEYRDCSYEVDSKTHTYVESRSDSDMSGGDFDSEDEVDDYVDDIFQIKKTWKTIGGDRVEERTPTQSDTSSEEDTYSYNDNDGEHIEILNGRQFLETIIEEESESNSCLDDQTAVFKEKPSFKEYDNIPTNSEEEECASNIYENNKEGTTGSTQPVTEVIKHEEMDDEYVESCFSETDIDCFVTDETNSEEDYHATEEYSDEYDEDNVIDNTAVLFNLGDPSNKLSVQMNNGSEANYNSTGTSGNICHSEMISESKYSPINFKDLHLGESNIVDGLGNTDETVKEPSACYRLDSQTQKTEDNTISVNLDNKPFQNEDDVHNVLKYNEENSTSFKQYAEHIQTDEDNVNFKLHHESFQAEEDNVHSNLGHGHLEAEEDSACPEVDNVYLQNKEDSLCPKVDNVHLQDKEDSLCPKVDNVHLQDKEDSLCPKVDNVHLQDKEDSLCPKVDNVHLQDKEDSACAKQDIEHPHTEDVSVCSKQDTELQTNFDLNTRQLVGQHPTNEIDAICNSIIPDADELVDKHYHLENIESHRHNIFTNSDLSDNKLTCGESDPSDVSYTSLQEPNDTELCRIAETLKVNENLTKWKENVDQLSTKSPIHIDNLSAIFDSSTNKTYNDDLKSNNPSTVSGATENYNTLDLNLKSTGEFVNLTSYLKGCAEVIQATELPAEHAYSFNENYGVSDQQSCLEDANSASTSFLKDNSRNSLLPQPVGEQLRCDNNNKQGVEHIKALEQLNLQARNSRMAQDMLVEEGEQIVRNAFEDNDKDKAHLPNHDVIRSNSHVEGNQSMVYLDYMEQDKNVLKDTVQCEEEKTHNHERTYNAGASFNEVLEPKSPKLISSQLDQIFHIPPESESSENKLEQLLINTNKGLFPSELICPSSKPDNLKQKITEPISLFPDYMSRHPGDEKTYSFTEEQYNDLTSLDKKPSTLNMSLSDTPEVKQVSLGHLAEKDATILNQCCQTLREHLTVVQDQKLHLDNQPQISDNLETLKIQLEQLESFESRLAAFSVPLNKDVKFAEQFLMSIPDDLPGEHLKELSDCLMKTFAAVREISSDRAKQIAFAVDAEMTTLAETHQNLLNQLQVLSDWIAANNATMDFSVNTNDVYMVKQTLQSVKNVSKQLSEQKVELETTAFDVQFFISEHAQDLSPSQSKQLLRLLNATQKSFQEAQRKISSLTESLKSHLLVAQDLNEQKDAEVQLQEHKEKLQEICDLLTQTENRLIGQQDMLTARDSPAELQHCQTEYEELQKDMQAGASELAEIVKNTEKFLQDHGDKLSLEERAVIEQKLKEAKAKFELLRKKAEESKKELENAVTTAIKKETEKSAAVEQLEESKNKIGSLLDWLSHVDEEAENGNRMKKPKIQQNGTYHKESEIQSILDGVEELNGNLIESDGKSHTMNVQKQSKEEDLSSQYQKVKAQHEKIVSQHQAVIIATQSAQALLEKQGRHLIPEEKEKLQNDIEALKAQYESALCDSERKMKVIQTVQEELEKFTTDYNEFENWLQCSKQELEHLETGADNFAGIRTKLQRQKSFSEDVISHKGDLRYITISGQRVLDAAKSCSKDDVVEDNNNVSTLETCKMVQSKLDLASENFKSLHTKCNVLGNNLKDLVDKYEHYKEASCGLLAGLQSSESAVQKRLSEPIAADTRDLQRQIEETKLFCEQVSVHQVGVEKLKRAAEGLLDSKGGLLLNKDEIQKPLDEIVGRYTNLSQSVNDWNEKLQITLTRSLSVQDGLDEMVDWMQGVEKNLKEHQQVPLNSSSIQEIITKDNMLEQDIASRQSSINAMNEKVNKFMETADSSTASSLQGKMNELSERFSNATEHTRERIEKMEDLKSQVELFEDLAEKVQSFLNSKLRALTETDGPGKDVTELSQYMQETSNELLEHRRSLEDLQKLVDELCVYAVPGDKALVLEKVNTMLKRFQDLEETVKAKEEDVSSCQNQMDSFQSLVKSLKHWFTVVNDRIPTTLTMCLEDLSKHLKETKILQEEWTQKGQDVHKVNSKGTALCNLITAVTSPAKTRSVIKSGRNIVNGAASPAVKENLTNKELATVQKGMVDVNEGYDHLGNLLKEKVCKLEAQLSQLQQVQEETNSLVHWLEKMHTTAAAWEAPADSKSVQEQVQQHKVFATEVKQYEGKVETLRDKLKSLIDSNADAPESQRWNDTLDQIESAWKDITQMTAKRQQILQESSNDLTQFQTAEAQLKQWLVEKELMASVLGPLSIDPNMLKTQKQQVQILLKEFDARKQQYEQLNSTGQRILSRPGDFPPCDEAVQEQLAAVACKWESLTGQLNDRCNRVDQAIVKSTDYQNLLNGLSEKLSALNNKLSSNMTLSSNPDAVRQKLETAKLVQEEVKLEVANIESARVLCDELSHLVKEEYLKAELNRQMDTIVKPFMDLKEKAGSHVEQLQSAFASCQKFHQMSEDFQTWIENKKKEQNEAAPISAKLDILKSLITETKQVQSALNAQHGSYEKIIAEGEKLLQNTEAEEKVTLQSQLSVLRRDWDNINKQVLEREHSLVDCQQKATKYRELVDNIMPWIEEYQHKVHEVKLSIDPVAIENSIGEVRALQKSVDKQRGMVEMLNSATESLLHSCQADLEIITDEQATVNNKVETLTDNLHNKRDSLENMALRLKDFQESVKDTEKQLAVAQEHLEIHNSLGAQACSNKHLTIMQAQQKALQSLKPQVELSKRLAQELVVDASDAEGVSDLLLQAESLQNKHKTISQQVEEKCSFLETKLQGIGHFQNSIREMFSQFAELDDELDSMSPVGRDRDTLQAQKEDISTYLKKLGDLITTNENANKTCKMMLVTETSPDLIGIKRDLEALNKQCNKLLDRAKSREEHVDGTITRIEEFYSTLKQFIAQLGTVEEHEESQGAVGMETDVINHQLNIFTTFQKEEIEPLQARLQDVNWLGQGLVQSAGKNTSTQSLEHGLEEVNTRWNTLNKKVALRAAQLQEALLHCGRFQDALESILSWLTDTEELVANQKSPSAEFKVVKAQIQEQKLLQRLLDDRKPTIDVIKREGGKIAATADQVDEEKILKQLSALERRWDELLKKAEIRNRQLDGILVVAEQFHDTLEPLSEWLSNTEKKLANSEPIGTQTPKLLQQITQHKVLQEDITAHNTILHQSLSIGQSLKALSSREEREMIQDKLDICQTRYMEIQERSSRRGELLQQAHCNAQIFGDDEVELMNWLTEVHDKLSQLSVQDYSTAVLTRQHTELLLLLEDILFRKQNVDQAIQNGLELLKHTTGDEVVVIQEKLDGIKSRYSDITKLSSNVSKVLEQALTLATQFHSTHEELGRWLDKVETELENYELQDHKAEDLNSIQERKKELQLETKTNKALLDSLNDVSSSLLELVPWRARGGLDRMVTEDNDRYRLVNDTLTQMVGEIDAARLRSQQFEQAVGAEHTWIESTKEKMVALGHIRLEQEQTVAQLQVQKGFAMEILRHKDTIDELVTTGDEIMSSFSEEEKQTMADKLTNLGKSYEDVCHLNAERNLQLERAVSLVNQFWETYEELWPWLTETEKIISELPPPALNYDTLRQQQEDIRQLRELIAEHKPHIDKMNKTGPQLLELSPEEGFFIQEKYIYADSLYSDIKEVVKKRAVALDEAISQSSQFHDKIDPTLENLQRIAERLRQPPSISAECEKIREQINENKNVSVELEKLQPVYEMLKMRGEEMIARSEGADKDISAKAVQDKLDQMVFIWEDIQALTEEREAQLLDVMELAEKFWCDHIALIATIKDTQDFIRELDEPGVDPSIVKQQQEAAEVIKEEIDVLQEELDLVIALGSELISACGEPDKPVVNKNIDELNSAWDTLNKTWKERVKKLDEAMQAAVQYQDGLQALFDWVDIATGRIETMPPIGTDLETVKQQITELKQFKTEAYHQQIELERLNHQKEMLQKKVTDENDKLAVEDSFKELKYLWQAVEDKIINRQHKLEGALLALGPFQHALDELLTWMTHTEGLLNEQKPIGGDPKTIEIELAKHHVLQNDVLAHKSSVETVQKAGNDLIASSEGEEASSLHSRLEALSQRWQNVLDTTEQRRKQLDSALFQAQGFHSEIEEMHQWLTDTERHLLASKPVGGLPETAREQLNTHLELCTAFEAKEHVYKSIMLKSQQLMERCIDDPETNMDQDINNLKEKWESVETKLSERKIKLDEALNLATGFHNSLQDFINWLTQAEQTLTMASPASLILDTVLFQIDEHKVFVTEVNAHKDKIMELDKTGTHLKYFSQKQDVVLIKNLLISVQSRWENVVQRSLERGRALDDARKRSKQFHEAFSKLMEWLEESEISLDSELEIANDPDKIKTQLTMHKEFQKTLGAKHSVYDTTTRSGRSLKEKATLCDDIQKLDDMLSEIRDKWDTVCGKSVERQNKLEEALLFSGQFTDALQALIDWLYRVEPQLAEDQPVHGDIDIVMNLIDNHKVFQKELGKRSSNIQALKRSARELIEGSHDDCSWVKAQMQELSTRWETVCTLSVSKQIRLEEALRQAEEFHSAVHVLLEWLAEAEQALRFHGVLPEDEESLKSLIEQHKEFMRKVEEKRTELNKGASMGEAILSVCHPDCIITIKHWITIIKARFEEVLTWAKQHQQRLAVALEDLLAKKELLESLLQWLQWAETTLNEKDKEDIPEEIDEVKALIAEHQAFMEEMTRKQPDVDKVTKTYKRKAAESTSGQSQIPVLGKGRTSRKRSPTPNLYPSGTQAPIETKNPRVNMLVSKWQQVWLLALERRRNLNDALDRLEELREFANFDFDIWRKKYMRWMNHKKSRVMDFFRRIDKDQDGKITRQEFIEGILSSKFPTSRLEMSAVADIFDRDCDGYIDYYEFVAALHPNKDAYKPVTDADKIEDEVTRQVAKCKCARRFQVEQIGDNKYRFFLGNQFGDSQQLRLVRILRSTVMVRVGGGWMALDEFLVKNDPCRVHHHGSKMLRSESNSSITTQPLIAKGRTNLELREKFMLPEGISQSMTPFRPKGRRSRPSSRGASPNRSNSSLNIQASPLQITGTSTPKTPLHITRNYGKPWLTNSKTSTPCKSPESPEHRLSSEEGTPIQGSKLRLPGYLSGKGFQSGEDSSLLTTAATKVRTQFADYRKTPSRAGSKAGSRSSSRRGSDASDFDISEIQSVCSDMSEVLHDGRPTPRSSSRSSSGKPSKIPTPQRRSPMSKLATKTTKR